MTDADRDGVSVATYHVALDDAGVVVGACRSNCPQPGMVNLDAATYAAAAARLGRCRLVGGTLEDYTPPLSLPAVPDTVTNYQARAVLIERGLFDKVDAALRSADMGVTASKLALQAWDYANGFSRRSPVVVAMAGALGLADDDVDQLFLAAAAVP